MKLLHEKDDAINDRKLIKSQVEKRRRERMNHSLERLKTMLLKEPQQVKGRTQHRVEKAEILEHTVLFLQKNTKECSAKVAGQKPSFQDGFSTCLQRASRFLGPKGRGLWIGPVLDATFAGRFTRSHKDPADDQSKPSSSSLTHTKSILQMLRQRSKSSQQALGVSSFAYPYRFPVQQSFPRVPQQPQAQSRLEMRAERPPTKEGSSQSSPMSQTLWRPWP
ncbi:hairy and enhancer of split related-7 isoform X1 [Nothobranchius furzeri]|uniref:Transcript variant X1 n=2 Tax=Nothobranchius furzeri TaxID=105023 RepID=A0A8C6KVM5_NOTFU|nr:transcript variant X1 [Nothobranchius furzeri]